MLIQVCLFLTQSQCLPVTRPRREFIEVNTARVESIRDKVYGMLRAQ